MGSVAPSLSMHFVYSSVIEAPVAKVFAFHERPDALERLIPPWQRVEIVRRTGGLETGARVEFRLRVGPLSIPWVAVHTGYEKNRLFVDRQVKGPFRYWEHRHKFCEDRGRTCLTDAITFSLPGGRIVDTLLGWAVKAQLRRMFRYRHEVTRRACEGG
jgi:ligand-binding SRPBCC domain-containing protein